MLFTSNLVLDATLEPSQEICNFQKEHFTLINYVKLDLHSCGSCLNLTTCSYFNIACICASITATVTEIEAYRHMLELYNLPCLKSALQRPEHPNSPKLFHMTLRM